MYVQAGVAGTGYFVIVRRNNWHWNCILPRLEQRKQERIARILTMDEKDRQKISSETRDIPGGNDQQTLHAKDLSAGRHETDRDDYKRLNRDGGTHGDGPRDRRVIDLEESNIMPHWAVPWSDLMMVAFVMFAVLFAYLVSKRDVADAFRGHGQKKETKTIQAAQKPASVAADVQVKPTNDITMEELYESYKKTVEESQANQTSVVITEDNSIKLSVQESMLFDLGKADLKPQAVEFLRKFADTLRKTRYKVRIEGHTDSYPIHTHQFPTNWELSVIRATNVARFLVEEANLESERFVVAGHSMYKPVAPNTTAENKAKNRRVEIIVVKEFISPS